MKTQIKSLLQKYLIKPKNQKIWYIPVPSCDAKVAKKVISSLNLMKKGNTAAIFVGINTGRKDSIV